jgi:hypothetical protein
MAFRTWGFWVMAPLAWAPLLGGQSVRARDLAKGKFLVASRLPDPFSEADGRRQSAIEPVLQNASRARRRNWSRPLGNLN